MPLIFVWLALGTFFCVVIVPRRSVYQHPEPCIDNTDCFTLWNSVSWNDISAYATRESASGVAGSTQWRAKNQGAPTSTQEDRRG